MHHGVLAVGKTIEEAAWIAEAVEYMSTLYLQARMIGQPSIIPNEELARLHQRFQSYGQ